MDGRRTRGAVIVLEAKSFLKFAGVEGCTIAILETTLSTLTINPHTRNRTLLSSQPVVEAGASFPYPPIVSSTPPPSSPTLQSVCLSLHPQRVCGGPSPRGAWVVLFILFALFEFIAGLLDQSIAHGEISS